MKIKIKLAKATRFDLPCRPLIQPWARLLFGARQSLRALALAELAKPGKHRFD